MHQVHVYVCMMHIGARVCCALCSCGFVATSQGFVVFMVNKPLTQRQQFVSHLIQSARGPAVKTYPPRRAGLADLLQVKSTLFLSTHRH